MRLGLGAALSWGGGETSTLVVRSIRRGVRLVLLARDRVSTRLALVRTRLQIRMELTEDKIVRPVPPRPVPAAAAADDAAAVIASTTFTRKVARRALQNPTLVVAGRLGVGGEEV